MKTLLWTLQWGMIRKEHVWKMSVPVSTIRLVIILISVALNFQLVRQSADDSLMC